jgi:hypothetical protein
LRPGDRIKVTLGSTVHKLVIPELSITPDRSDATYRGRGPAGASLVVVCPYRAIGASTCTRASNVTVGSRGNWTFNARDVRGGDVSEVYWNSASGDEVWALTHVPFFIVTIGRAEFRGVGIQGERAWVSVNVGTTPVQKGLGSGTASRYYADFAGRFRDGDGNPVEPAVGDLVQSNIAPDAAVVIEDVEATADGQTNHVQGRCPQSTQYAIVRELDQSRMWRDRDQGAVSQFDDSFDIYVPGGFDATARYFVGCQYRTGDFVQGPVTIH